MATACAVFVATLAGPPQIEVHDAGSVEGLAVPVMPETESTRAAARAAASAERCASSFARYRVTTSIERAAMAMMAIIATATSTMGIPRCRGKGPTLFERPDLCLSRRRLASRINGERMHYSD